MLTFRATSLLNAAQLDYCRKAMVYDFVDSKKKFSWLKPNTSSLFIYFGIKKVTKFLINVKNYFVITLNQQPPPFCYGGIPGIPGMPGKSGSPGMHGKPGSPGSPGRDGRDGRDGAKGNQGNPGKTGPQGPQGTPGINGNNGAKGEPGAQGPPGQKGQRGENGATGIPGTPSAMSYKNWKECAWKNLNDDKEHGLIKVINSSRIQTKLFFITGS